MSQRRVMTSRCDVMLSYEIEAIPVCLHFSHATWSMIIEIIETIMRHIVLYAIQKYSEDRAKYGNPVWRQCRVRRMTRCAGQYVWQFVETHMHVNYKFYFLPTFVINESIKQQPPDYSDHILESQRCDFDRNFFNHEISDKFWIKKLCERRRKDDMLRPGTSNPSAFRCTHPGLESQTALYAFVVSS